MATVRVASDVPNVKVQAPEKQEGSRVGTAGRLSASGQLPPELDTPRSELAALGEGQITSHSFGSYRVSSAPLLQHATASPHTSAWFCSSFAGSDRTAKRPTWRPLGETWRQWEADPLSSGTLSRHSQLRSNVDDGRPFMNASVPHWGKTSTVRMKNVLEHELAWAYYRMRRHAEHPLRKEVGDPYLPQTDVCSQMRSGIGSKFQFWRDLRPPFQVHEIKAADDWTSGHPDGKLYMVTYLCSIDYQSERMWNEKSDGGTFDNKIHSVAQVRIPDNFPKQRPLHIVSWGRPQLNYQPDDDQERHVEIDPYKWMPIADELGKRADDPKFAACREATKRAIPSKGVRVPPLQKLLIGPHASLPQINAVEQNRDPRMSEDQERGVSKGGKPRLRQHRIFTAAGGFVRYSG